MSARIFISYSHQDTKWLDRLRVHLEPFVLREQLSVWVDTAVQPGEHWRERTTSALRDTDAAVLLVTANFLASAFIKDNEVPRLLARAESHGARIFWNP